MTVLGLGLFIRPISNDHKWRQLATAQFHSKLSGYTVCSFVCPDGNGNSAFIFISPFSYFLLWYFNICRLFLFFVCVGVQIESWALGMNP
jgi:hypothetical protein